MGRLSRSLPGTAQDGPLSGEMSILATALSPNPRFTDEETEAGACPGWQQEGGVRFELGPGGSRLPPTASWAISGLDVPERPGPRPARGGEDCARAHGGRGFNKHDGIAWGPLPWTFPGGTRKIPRHLIYARTVEQGRRQASPLETHPSPREGRQNLRGGGLYPRPPVAPPSMPDNSDFELWAAMDVLVLSHVLGASSAEPRALGHPAGLPRGGCRSRRITGAGGSPTSRAGPSWHHPDPVPHLTGTTTWRAQGALSAARC